MSCPNCGGIKSFFQQGMGPSSCISPSMYLFQDIYAKTPQLPGELSSSGQTHSRASSDTHSPPCHVLSLARRLCSTCEMGPYAQIAHHLLETQQGCANAVVNCGEGGVKLHSSSLSCHDSIFSPTSSSYLTLETWFFRMHKHEKCPVR